MRNPNRIEPFCNKLAEAWKMVPDWRFGQFVINFLRWYGRDPFYLEDDAFEELLDKYIKEML